MDKIELRELPIIIERDKDYYEALKKELRAFKKIMKKYLGDKEYKILENICRKITESILTYYKGDISGASTKISNLIKFLLDNNDDSKILLKDYNLKYCSTNKVFYKARVGNPINGFSKDEMIHIPYSMREFIKTQRFSIPGTPCIYLGKTSYICWMEMNKPAFNVFNVSSVLVNEEMSFFNLAYTSKGNIESAIKLNDINLYKKAYMYPLIIATSFTVSLLDRYFKSEYIVSQLVTQAIAKNNIDGILYFSKKTKSYSIFNSPTLCVAIPAKFQYKKKMATNCNKLNFGNVINFAEYETLYNWSKKCNMVVSLGMPFNIAGEEMDYAGSEFDLFDKYLNSKR